VQPMSLATPPFAGWVGREAVMVDAVRAKSPRTPASKLNPALLAVAERRNRTTPAFVKNGKAEIVVTLDDASPATLAALKALGFETEARPNNGKLLIGRIAIEKLKALAALQHVRWVMPQMSM